MAMCKLCGTQVTAGEVMHRSCIKDLLIEMCWTRCMDYEIDLRSGTPGATCEGCKLNQTFGLFSAAKK